MSELSKFPGLDDLALKIERVAQEHPDYSRAWEVVQACCTHLRAIEAISRMRKKLHELERAMEKKETPATVDEAIEQRMEEARNLPDLTIPNTSVITFNNPLTAPSFTFSGNENKTLITIRPDGTIERGEAFTTADEASLEFWKIIERLGMRRRVPDTPMVRSRVMSAIAHVREQNGWPPFEGWIAVHGEKEANRLTAELAEEAAAAIKAMNAPDLV